MAQLQRFFAGSLNESSGRPTVIIDLPARLVASNVLFDGPTQAEKPVDGDDDWENDPHPRLHLSGDWALTSSIADWQARAEPRRAERLANPPFDTRAILYGEPLLEFIARQCWETFRDRPQEPVSDDSESAWPVAHEFEYELLRPIHARWLMTPRDDLRGQAPREVMLAKRECISLDIQDRQMQWLQEGVCPRGLDPESAALASLHIHSDDDPKKAA